MVGLLLVRMPLEIARATQGAHLASKTWHRQAHCCKQHPRVHSAHHATFSRWLLPPLLGLLPPLPLLLPSSLRCMP